MWSGDVGVIKYPISYNVNRQYACYGMSWIKVLGSTIVSSLLLFLFSYRVIEKEKSTLLIRSEYTLIVRMYNFQIQSILLVHYLLSHLSLCTSVNLLFQLQLVRHLIVKDVTSVTPLVYIPSTVSEHTWVLISVFNIQINDILFSLSSLHF